jgi:signal transduction histidine kinase
VTFDERRRIERELHDGVQQDLIAMCVRLQLVRGLVDSDPAAALDELELIQQEAHAALDRVRALADHVYPALLDARGLPDALRSLGAHVEATGIGRYPAELEATAYFFCRDALAEADAPVTVSLRDEDGALAVDAGGRRATFATRPRPDRE